ncbi:MAG: response regulator transcription factor [bacterium]
MNALRALIVDSDHDSIALLRKLLSPHDSITILGHALDVNMATLLSQAFQPDLIFLNPRLPGGNGFEILSCLPHSSRLICVTEIEHFAVRAFEVGAVDYLLKPLSPVRLSLAIARLAPVQRIPDPDVDSRILIKSPSGQYIFTAARISHIASHNHSTRVFLIEGEEIECNRSMLDWSRLLAKHGFQRLDRTLLANPTHIQRLDRISRNEAILFFANGGRCIKIGRVAMRRLRELAIF